MGWFLPFGGLLLLGGILMVLRIPAHRVWLLALVPTGWLLLFYSFVLRARWTLGYWPRPYEPDPGTLGFGLHAFAIYGGYAVVLASAGALLVLFASKRSLFVRRVNQGALLVFALTFLLWWWVLRQDPGSFLYWFHD